MKIALNKQKNWLSVQFPPRGRVLITFESVLSSLHPRERWRSVGKTHYLKFPTHEFIFPRRIEDNHFYINEQFQVYFLLRNDQGKLFEPPMFHHYDQGKICLGHVNSIGPIQEIITDFIRRFWETSSAAYPEGSSYKQIMKWKEAANSDFSHFIPFYDGFGEFEPTTWEEIRKSWKCK